MCFYFLDQINYCLGQKYNGFHFQDNLVEERFSPDNGYAVYHLDIPIPNSVILFLTVLISYLMYH